MTEAEEADKGVDATLDVLLRFLSVLRSMCSNIK